MCRAFSVAPPVLYSWPSCVPAPCRLPIAQVDEGSALSFEVVKSSGATKSLETIELEQEQKSSQLVESTFDPTLVYGVIVVGAVFAVIGVGACTVIVIVNRKKSDKSKIHAASENERSTYHVNQNHNGTSLFYKRASSADHAAFKDKGEITGPVAHKFDIKSLNYARMDAPERVALNESQERMSPLKQRLEKRSR